MQRFLTLAAGVLVAAAVAAGPASATVRERFTDAGDYAYSVDCGFAVSVVGSHTDEFTIREGKNKDAGTFPVLNRFSYKETWTNAETGEWFTISGKAIFNEVTATRVEGSIFEFRAHDSGQPYVVTDAAGKVVARNRGSVWMSYLFDTGGDNEPGGEWVADTGFRVSGPHPSLSVDPCEYAVQLIG
jgi:hypothetical protein